MKGRSSQIFTPRGQSDSDRDRDNHGVRALRGSDAGKTVSWPNKKRGGAVTGAKPKRRLDRAARHPDAPEDRSLIKSMVKPTALKHDGRPRYAKGGGVGRKGKTTVNVIIAPQGGNNRPQLPPQMPAAAPPPPPSMPPRPSVPTAPPPGSPGMAGAAAQMPMMPRKKGGRVGYPIEDGSGGARGRLEKEKAYGRKAKEGETFGKHEVSGP